MKHPSAVIIASVSNQPPNVGFEFSARAVLWNIQHFLRGNDSQTTNSQLLRIVKHPTSIPIQLEGKYNFAGWRMWWSTTPLCVCLELGSMFLEPYAFYLSRGWGLLCEVSVFTRFDTGHGILGHRSNVEHCAGNIAAVCLRNDASNRGLTGIARS